ncbi:hypothetical protein BJ742DRAFT_841335 [Cladochytrium replicatum]|nr:hypothetical protein BJ742DRAFT_841335 [Cladochytrium replicatum]
MDPVVLVLLFIGLLSAVILCFALYWHYTSLYHSPHFRSRPFRILSSVMALGLLVPTLMFRTVDVVLLAVYFPDQVGKSNGLRHLRWDLGAVEFVNSLMMVLGDVLLCHSAYCYLLVLMDRYYAFREILPLGKSVHFRRFLVVLYALLYLFYYVQFTLVNGSHTAPYNTSEQILISLSRITSYLAIAAFDLWLSISLCGAAFSATSLDFFEQNPMVSPYRTTVEDESTRSWSLPKQLGMRRFGVWTSFVGYHTASEGESEGGMYSSFPLQDPPAAHFPRNFASLNRSRPISSVIPLTQPQSASLIPHRPFSPPFPPTPEPNTTLPRPQRHSPTPFRSRRRPISILAAVTRSPPHRHTLTLLICALLTDVFAVFLFVSHLMIRDLRPYAAVLEYVASCAVAIHISIAVFLMHSFKDVVVSNRGGGKGRPVTA